jgi:hypothetical protein
MSDISSGETVSDSELTDGVPANPKRDLKEKLYHLKIRGDQAFKQSTYKILPEVSQNKTQR